MIENEVGKTEMGTLKSLRIELGWSMNRLSKEARVHFQTAKKAEEGEMIPAATAKAIADALSRGYGKPIKVLEIEGLNVQ